MKSFTKLSVGLLCALGMSLSACGKKEEKPETKPETKPEASKPAPETTKAPTEPIEAAKPAEPATATPPVPAAKLELTAKDLGKDFEKSLEGGNIVALGKTFPAKDLCNESTLLNPDTVEVFETGTPDQLVVLCPGGLDGETNVVTLFENGKEPRTASVSPLDSSHRVEDEKLTSTVQALLGAN